MGDIIGAAGNVATVEAVAVVVGETGGAMTGDVVEEEETWGAEVMVESLWLEVEVVLPVAVLGGAGLTIGAVPSEGVGWQIPGESPEVKAWKPAGDWSVSG